jgi:sterol desaturase/sphingolipid hydroxylase (fatty acid hydroxylase superfamily)
MDFNATLNFVHSQQKLPWLLFAIAFLALSLWEIGDGAYEEKTPRSLRWPNNLLLALVNALFLRLLLPGFSIWAATNAAARSFGVLNQVKVPELLNVVLTFFLLDWFLYYLHRSYHAIPWLWKWHRVHHSDPEVDVTTGLRFHPVELALTTLAKAFFIFLLGPSIYGVFLFEAILAIYTLYDHSNIAIPQRIEKTLRWLLLTPRMHRVHHSKKIVERNSDYGFIFSIWDRLLGTYQSPDQLDQSTDFGLDLFQNIRFLRLKALLLQPFMDKKGRFHWRNLTKDV